jgi:acyl-homoserine lactone acylase PvdQ
MREIVDAYCAGINSSFQESGRAARVTPQMVESFSRWAYGRTADASHILLAPSRSTEGATIAIIDPYSDWISAARPYEARVYAPDDGLSFAGAGPPGVPFPLMGNNASISIAISGAGEGGTNALEQAWGMITAKNLAAINMVLALGQFPKQTFLIGTADGDIYDSASGTANPASGVLRNASASRPAQAESMLRKLLADTHDFSFDSAISLAFSTDVYKAETWQERIAAVAPELEFTRMISGWSRRADADSRPALAFYLFKMALGEDAAALEPPDHVSAARIRAALRNAQNRMEKDYPVDGGFGSQFKISRDAAQRSFPAGGGTVTAAGMATLRAIGFEARGSQMIGRSGQSAVQVVLLTRQPKSASALCWGESDQASSAHFDDQARELFGKGQMHPTYFGDRKEVEKHSKERKELTFTP